MKSNCEILITKPMTNWKKAGDGLNKHQSSQLHLLAVQKQKLNSDRFAKQKGGIDTLNAKEIKERAIKNTEILKGITRSVVFLGTQGLPFRGHDESLENDQKNPGNFLASLQLLKQYDKNLENNLKKKSSSKGSVTMTSHKVQDELISIIGKKNNKNEVG